MIPYKDDNPTAIVPYVTYALLGLNVLIFLVSLPAHQAAVWEFGFIPWELATGRMYPGSETIGGTAALFSSMFMHGGLMHLGGNMLFLWVFGNNIEDAMGHVPFLLFYVLTGLTAHAFQFGHVMLQAGGPPAEPIAREFIMQAVRNGQGPKLQWFIPTVGASGAISGILAAYFMLYRSARVYMLIPIGFFLTTIVVPAGLAIGYWFLIQLLSGLFSGGVGGGVAWWAHIGGFAGGLVAYRAFLSKKQKEHDRLRKMWKRVQKQWDE